MSGMALDGNFATVQASAQDAYEKALANVTTQKAQMYQKYGYNPDGTLDTSNPYGLFQQLQKKYADTGTQLTQQHQQLDQQYGVTEKADGTYTVNDGGDGTFQRLAQDRTTALGRLDQERTKTLRDAGMGAQFDANGNPVSLSVSGDNPYGAIQKLLANEGTGLRSAEQNSEARGLGTKGVGGQDAADVRFSGNADQANFRQQLLDSLTNNATQQQDTNTSYTRNVNDATTGLKSSIADLMKSSKDTTYQKGLDEYSLGQSLLGEKSGLDNMLYQAQLDKSNALGNGMLQDILNRIANGDFANAGGGTGTADAPAGNAKDAAYVGPANVTAQTIHVGPNSDVNPRVVSIAEQRRPTVPTPAKALPNAYNTNKNKRG